MQFYISYLQPEDIIYKVNVTFQEMFSVLVVILDTRTKVT